VQIRVLTSSVINRRLSNTRDSDSLNGRELKETTSLIELTFVRSDTKSPEEIINLGIAMIG